MQDGATRAESLEKLRHVIAGDASVGRDYTQFGKYGKSGFSIVPPLSVGERPCHRAIESLNR